MMALFSYWHAKYFTTGYTRTYESVKDYDDIKYN